jgi:transposase
MSAIELRGDYTASALRLLAKNSKDAKQTRRLLSLATIYDGGSRTQAGRVGGVGVQVVRDWVVKFNTHGPDGLIDDKAPGKRPTLNDEQRKALAAIVEKGPTPYQHDVVRWRCKDLSQWLFDQFGVQVSVHIVGRELRAMNYRKLSTRPRHYRQDPTLIDAFKKSSPAVWLKSRSISKSGAR